MCHKSYIECNATIRVNKLENVLALRLSNLSVMCIRDRIVVKELCIERSSQHPVTNLVAKFFLFSKKEWGSRVVLACQVTCKLPSSLLSLIHCARPFF